MSKLPQFAPDNNPVGLSHHPLMPGHENSTYDKNRHEDMRIRTFRYGFFRVATEPVTHLMCCNCWDPIYSDHLVIDGIHYHGKCFKSK